MRMHRKAFTGNSALHGGNCPKVPKFLFFHTRNGKITGHIISVVAEFQWKKCWKLRDQVWRKLPLSGQQNFSQCFPFDPFTLLTISHGLQNFTGFLRLPSLHWRKIRETCFVIVMIPDQCSPNLSPVISQTRLFLSSYIMWKNNLWYFLCRRDIVKCFIWT